MGICRAYDEYIIEHGSDSFACKGVVPVDGNGSTAVQVAKDFVGLGFKVLYLGDSDTADIVTKKKEMEAMGINVLIWNDNLAIENRVFNDLPWQEFLKRYK